MSAWITHGLTSAWGGEGGGGGGVGPWVPEPPFLFLFNVANEVCKRKGGYSLSLSLLSLSLSLSLSLCVCVCVCGGGGVVCVCVCVWGGGGGWIGSIYWYICRISSPHVYCRDEVNDVLHISNMGALTILSKKQDYLFRTRPSYLPGPALLLFISLQRQLDQR